MKIYHRNTGAVLYEDAAPTARQTVCAAVEARTDLSSADLRSANLSSADLSSADLGGANLWGAGLSGADLRGANLTDATLSGADLRSAEGVFALGSPDCWYAFAWLRDGYLSIRVGCREKRLDEAREYWAGKSDRREVLAAVEHAAAVAQIRGWRTE